MINRIPGGLQDSYYKYLITVAMEEKTVIETDLAEKSERIGELTDTIEELKSKNLTLLEKLRSDKSLAEIKYESYESTIKNLEEERFKLMEQLILQEKNNNLLKQEIKQLQESCKFLETEKEKVVENNESIKKEIDKLKELNVSLRKSNSPQSDERPESPSYYLFNESELSPKRDEKSDEKENVKKLSRELLEVKEESEKRLKIIKELSLVNNKLESEIRETSFLLESKHEEESHPEPGTSFLNKSGIEDDAQSLKNSIFGELVNEMQKQSQKEQEPLFSIPEFSWISEFQTKIADLFSRLNATDLAALNKGLGTAFDTANLVQMSNSIIENLLKEIEALKIGFGDHPLVITVVEILAKMGNLRIILNEYLKLYYEKTVKNSNPNLVNEKKKGKTFFAYLIETIFSNQSRNKSRT